MKLVVLLFVVATAAAAGVGFVFIHGAGTVWAKTKAWFGHSTTILFARLVALAGAVSAALGPALDLLNDQTMSAQVQAILDPKFVPYYVLAIGLITEMFRWRTAGKSDGGA